MPLFLVVFYFILSYQKYFATIEAWFLFYVLKFCLTANEIYLQDLQHITESVFHNTVNTTWKPLRTLASNKSLLVDKMAACGTYTSWNKEPYTLC